MAFSGLGKNQVKKNSRATVVDLVTSLHFSNFSLPTPKNLVKVIFLPFYFSPALLVKSYTKLVKMVNKSKILLLPKIYI